MDYVIDTNVFVDLFGLDASTNVDPYRWKRAHHALSMALIFDRDQAKTWALHREPFVVLARNFSDNDSKIHGYHLTFFVMERLLPKWSLVLTVNIDAGISGNDADRLLVRTAHGFGVPLISNETKSNGTIVRTSTSMGVTLLTTQQLCSQKKLNSKEWTAFFERFDQEAPGYCSEKGGRTSEQLRDFREWLRFFAGPNAT